MIFSFFYNLLVGSNFIPRRNFHITTEKYGKTTRLIFRSRYFRVLFKYISNTLSDFNPVCRSIRIRLFYLQSALEYDHIEDNLKIDKKRYTIDYGCETRNAIVLKQDEKVSIVIDGHSHKKLSCGICILENVFQIQPKVSQCDININIEITSNSYQERKVLNFPLPVDEKKHGIMHRKIGDGWFDFALSLENFKSEKILVVISVSFSNASFTMFHPSNNKIEDLRMPLVPCIAISMPKLTKNKKNKKILLISGESLTDPFWLDRVNDNVINYPNIYNLSKDAIRYDRSYSMVDSTLPSIMTFLTGTFPSQHSFGDYTIPIYQQSPSDKVEFLSEILKKSGYTTVCQTSYPRFDVMHGWGRGFDRYFQAEYPWSSNAPDASKVARVFEELRGDDVFMYLHLTRLHGPFLSSDTLQNPQESKAEELDAAKNGNFLPMYFSQMKIFDDQIGIIVDYLKRTDQYKDTMIMLTGDHGVSIPPNWSSLSDVKYAHYEEHLRTPLIVKTTDWYKEKPTVKHSPVSAQKEIFELILKSNNINLPGYFKNLPQYNKEFLGYAISETVYHPKKDNYAITIISNKYKYWMLAKVNWDDFKITKIVDEKLFYIDKNNGIVDESISVLDKEYSVRSELKKKAIYFFNTSSKYRLNNVNKKYPNTIN